MKVDYLADRLVLITSYRLSLHARLEMMPAWLLPPLALLHPRPPILALLSRPAPENPGDEAAHNYRGDQSPGGGGGGGSMHPIPPPAATSQSLSLTPRGSANKCECAPSLCQRLFLLKMASFLVPLPPQPHLHSASSFPSRCHACFFSHCHINWIFFPPLGVPAILTTMSPSSVFHRFVLHTAHLFL